jgi:hypothetical protein
MCSRGRHPGPPPFRSTVVDAYDRMVAVRRPHRARELAFTREPGDA